LEVLTVVSFAAHGSFSAAIVLTVQTSGWSVVHS